MVLITVCTFFRASFYRTLDSWKLIPHDETFTELYIDNYNDLPMKTVPNQAVPFSFVIHNLEGTSTTYLYQVYAQIGTSSRRLVESGWVPLAKDGFQNINGTYTVGSTTDPTTIYIELPNQALSLHFMIPRR